MRLSLDPSPLNRANRNLQNFRTNVMPQALQEALNVVAFRARKAQRANAAKRLDRAKQFTLSSFAARRARRIGRLYESAVFVLPRMAEVLARLEDGGRLPQGQVPMQRRLENQYGSLAKRFYAQRLLTNTKKYFEGEINGLNGVWERVQDGPRKRNKKTGRFQKSASSRLRLAILYVERPRYEPQLGFESVARAAGKTFRAEAERQIQRRMIAAGFR